MPKPTSFIAAVLVIYTTIDHHSCRSTEEDSSLISHHHGANGVRTVLNDDENRPTLDTAPASTQPTAGGSMQYLHYDAARRDDDNQYRDHDYDSDRSAVIEAQRRVGMPLAGVTGPVHTYIKTDKNANFKWGVRHFAGKRYGG